MALEIPRPAGQVLPSVPRCLPHEHYLSHRPRYIDNAGKRRRAATVQRMSYLLTFFETHPCVDCHETDSSVLEFDHLGNKAFNISQGFRDRAWGEVLAEIDKCEVRCANCHRQRTAETRGWYRALMLVDSADSAVDVPFTTPGGDRVEPSE